MNFINNKFQQSFEVVAQRFLSKLQYGELTVIFPSGTVNLFKGIKNGPKADLLINNYKFISKIFKRKSIGFAESYMDGDFSSNNLTNLLLLAFRNENYFLKNLKTNIFYNIYSKFKHFLNENTKSQSKKNIEYHYDLGNNFYNKWLDTSMTYSAAYFEKDNQNLLEAQLNKYNKIAEALKLNENSEVLEIGCGWGGFSAYAAKNFKSKIDAITISQAQFEYASNKIQTEGLGEKVSIKLKDYREINKQYSNIASIEMFEAVGQKYWENYFDILKRSLAHSGRAALQIITIDEKRSFNYQNQPDFIQQYIFPGGMLPTKRDLNEINQKVGLDFVEIKSFGLSYAKTLQLWNDRFQSSWYDLVQLGFNERFKRMWEYYLSYCETGFLCKSTDVSHYLINK
ncbi:MAG: SAM-dependent methyltransferase [Pelagibacteraceae bacterium]|nr:SAM-dependent methyltransferase [Pelagibacteraceae bacterium]|tara:strand:+ start:5099 stop:6292 length:1194 start_codon:yes stop_codon:yes gene_type:complete